jgi:hypothetical protein
MKRTIFLFGVSSWPRRSVRCPGRTQPKANRPLKAPLWPQPAAGFFFPDRLGLRREPQRKSMAPLPASPTYSMRPNHSLADADGVAVAGDQVEPRVAARVIIS